MRKNVDSLILSTNFIYTWQKDAIQDINTDTSIVLADLVYSCDFLIIEIF
jgi:hypothetical protein